MKTKTKNIVVWTLTFLLVALIVGSVVKADINSNLVAWWALSEGSGSTTADLSGNSHTGTIASATWTTGYQGSSAVKFSGTAASKITFTAIDFPADFSVSLWFNVTELTGAHTGIFVGAGAGNWVYMEPSNLIVDINSVNLPFVMPSLTVGIWYYLTLTRVSGIVHAYLNGVESTTGGQYFSGTFQVDSIGHYSTDEYSFKGVIDDIRLYDIALSSNDIAHLYATIQNAGFESGLIGWTPSEWIDHITETDNGPWYNPDSSNNAHESIKSLTYNGSIGILGFYQNISAGAGENSIGVWSKDAWTGGYPYDPVVLEIVYVESLPVTYYAGTLGGLQVYLPYDVDYVNLRDGNHNWHETVLASTHPTWTISRIQIEPLQTYNGYTYVYHSLSAYGNLYVDDVSLIYPDLPEPTATPTPTPSPSPSPTPTGTAEPTPTPTETPPQSMDNLVWTAILWGVVFVVVALICVYLFAWKKKS